jgi:hypothetical protein
MPSAPVPVESSPPATPGAHAAGWSRIQQTAEAELFDLLGGKGGAHTGLRRDVAALRSALLGTAPSALEHLVVDRIVTTWLMLQYATTLQTATHTTMETSRGPGAELVDRIDRRAERAARQHLDAVRQLATVRRLLSNSPLMQANVLSVNLGNGGARS